MTYIFIYLIDVTQFYIKKRKFYYYILFRKYS